MLDFTSKFQSYFFVPVVFKIFISERGRDSEFDSLESMGKPIGSSKATGRSEGEISIIFSVISKQGLKNEEDMCKISNSKSTKKNTDRPRKVIKEYAEKSAWKTQQL